MYIPANDEPRSIDPQPNTVEIVKKVLAVPRLSQTVKLPGVALFHPGMRMRLTTTLQQPVAVPYVECALVGFKPDTVDRHHHIKIRATSGSELPFSHIIR